MFVLSREKTFKRSEKLSIGAAFIASLQDSSISTEEIEKVYTQR